MRADARAGLRLGGSSRGRASLFGRRPRRPRTAPSAAWGALPAQMSRRAALIGPIHGDVQADVADGVARGGEPAAVAELSEDRHRGQLTDAVVAHQRLAAGLARAYARGCRSSAGSCRSSASIIRRATVTC